LSKKPAAFLFKPEVIDGFVFQTKIPFVRIAMLKNPPPIKIMLAHRIQDCADRLRD